jgi:hypothetical protein
LALIHRLSLVADANRHNPPKEIEALKAASVAERDRRILAEADAAAYRSQGFRRPDADRAGSSTPSTCAPTLPLPSCAGRAWHEIWFDEVEKTRLCRCGTQVFDRAQRLRLPNPPDAMG